MDRDLTESPVLTRVRELVLPIASDLGLELYDLEARRGHIGMPGLPADVQHELNEVEELLTRTPKAEPPAISETGAYPGRMPAKRAPLPRAQPA